MTEKIIIYKEFTSYIKYNVPLELFLHACAIILLYLKMIILYNTSSDWSRELHDKANKTSCLLGNKYHVSPLWKSRDFSFQWYKKPI